MATGIILMQKEELISGVKTMMNIPFTAADLTSPTQEKLQTVYGGFASSILQMTDAQLSQMPLHLLETAQESCNEEATGIVLFAKSLSYVFKAALVNDFSISDLISPIYRCPRSLKCMTDLVSKLDNNTIISFAFNLAAKRTRYLLSALVNFSQFLISHEKDKINGLAKLESFVKANQSYISKRERLQDRIAHLRERKIENKEKIQQMNLNALRIKHQTLIAHLEKRENQVSRKYDEREELHNIKIITKSTILLQQGKDAVDEKRIRAHKLDVRENMIVAVSDFAPSALKVVEKVADDVQRYENGTKKHEAIGDTSTETNMKLRNTLAEIQNTKRALNSIAEKKQRRTFKYQQKVDSHKENEQHWEKEQIKRLADIEKNETIVKSCSEELKQVTEHKLTGKKQHKQNMAAMKMAHDKLQKNLSLYNDSMTTHCQQITLKLQKLE